MEIILIAAMAANRVIGRNNDIPWNIPGEQSRFKKITMGHSLIMGRKTWQSIGRPLPGRQNIVLTRKRDFRPEGCTVVHSLRQGITAAEGKKVFIIGGAQVYRLALDQADRLILTRLERAVEGDVCFPKFFCPPFELIRTDRITDPVPYRIETYQRKCKQIEK